MTSQAHTVPGPRTRSMVAAESTVVAHNYEPLEIVIDRGAGAWVTDVDGNEYLDALAAYSALNFGHRHPDLMAAMRTQLDRLTLTSRAFYNDQLGPFAIALAELLHKDMVLPMNTGAEAVETAIKVARAWGYRVKKVAPGRAKIIVAHGNFHGRTISIISFSDDPGARNDFGPYTPGFTSVPYGDIEELRAAIDQDTVAVLIEPIQGEAGVIIPPHGYLNAVRTLTHEHGILFIADEIQCGLGRTGALTECARNGVVPDLYILGKALGGGILPVSAVVGDEAVLGVLRPGEHGSTFGGNPLAAAVGLAVVNLLEQGTFQERAHALGPQLRDGLEKFLGTGVVAVRSVGLWAGMDIDPALADGHEFCRRLAQHGVLAKETHGSTIRFAPPLTVGPADLEFLLAAVGAVLTELQAGR